MKRLIPFSVAAMTLAASSCHNAEDIIYSLDKISYQCFLRNESGQDVTVIMRPSRHSAAEECAWFVPKDSTVEIPDSEKWGLEQRIYESDTVFFRFADGSCILHYYTTKNYPSDNHIFVPQTNNIFYTGFSISGEADSWTTTKIRPKRYRREYVIRTSANENNKNRKQ